jgi:hypothetical protein
MGALSLPSRWLAKLNKKKYFDIPPYRWLNQLHVLKTKSAV